MNLFKSTFFLSLLPLLVVNNVLKFEIKEFHTKFSLGRVLYEAKALEGRFIFLKETIFSFLNFKFIFLSL